MITFIRIFDPPASRQENLHQYTGYNLKFYKKKCDVKQLRHITISKVLEILSLPRVIKKLR